jgi:hypothetical protein
MGNYRVEGVLAGMPTTEQPNNPKLPPFFAGEIIDDKLFSQGSDHISR